MPPTITPKLKLREQARKPLLSSIRKLRFPGSMRTKTSQQMTEAPTTQAGGEGCLRGQQRSHETGETESKQAAIWRDEPMPLTMHNIHPRVSLSSSLVTKAILAPRPHNQSPYSPLIAKHEGGDVVLSVGLLLCIDMVENRG